ncbi:unnamed protein product [Angiostrongylus costaricensis]|uniref:MFS domain-containing protein n=1 Tax=Angiostrongylus costaricensis TaxID=334426 RepID=A0A158PI89_ANGCS|nr:unnamed protein product [Angiostrongylus costaricensis]
MVTICTYNACTLASESSIEGLLMQAGKIRYDVITLAETRRLQPFNTVYDTGEELFLGTCDNRGVGGVGVLVNSVVSAFAYEILLTVGLDGLQASLANIVFCLVAAEKWIGWCVVVTICIFNLLFTIGPGPISFFVPGELVGQRARAATYTWVNIVMNGIRSALLAVYFPLRALLGGPLSYFLLFFAPCIITAAICYYWLPETSGKTPEEVFGIGIVEVIMFDQIIIMDDDCAGETNANYAKARTISGNGGS